MTEDEWSLDSDIEELWGMIYHSPYNIQPMPTNSPMSGSMEQIQSSSSSWCLETQGFLEELIKKCESQVEIHNNNKKYYLALKNWLQVPSICISVVMTGMTQESPDMLTRTAFFLNSVLQALTLYFDAGTKAKLNSKARDQYTKIIQECQQILACPVDKRPPCRETLDDFSKEYMRILASSP